jgi:hypothetical protein
MFASFHSSGRTPSSKDLLNNMHRDGEMINPPLRMVKLTTEQRVFVVTTQTLTQSVTEVLNYLDECRTIKLNSQRYNDAQK